MGTVVALLIVLAPPLLLASLAYNWLCFVAVGRPLWISFVPGYSNWQLFKLVGKPGPWSLLLFVPFLNFIGLLLLLVVYVELYPQIDLFKAKRPVSNG